MPASAHLTCHSRTFGTGCHRCSHLLRKLGSASADMTFRASSDQHLQRSIATRIDANLAKVRERATGEMCRRVDMSKTAAPFAVVF